MKAWVIKKMSEIIESSEPLEMIEFPIPELKDNEVLIKVSACGICHTELDEIEGRLMPSILPVIPGHQVIGKIVEKKNIKNTHLEIGDRVGVGWIYSSCGECVYCKRGDENLCIAFKATGKDAHGGYAEYMIAKSEYVYKIPSNLTDFEAAPLLCAGAIGYRALKLAKLDENSNLGLAGFGASAHLVAKMAKKLYPGVKIFAFARNSKEQEFARELGCVWSGDFDENPNEMMNAIIDTTPVWMPVVKSLEKLSPGGRLVINAIRKVEVDKDYLTNLSYSKHLWQEKEIKTVANITRSDIKEFFDIIEKTNLKPEVQIFNFEDANKALKEIKFQKIRGAKVLKIE